MKTEKGKIKVILTVEDIKTLNAAFRIFSDDAFEELEWEDEMPIFYSIDYRTRYGKTYFKDADNNIIYEDNDFQFVLEE